MSATAVEWAMNRAYVVCHDQKSGVEPLVRGLILSRG